MVELEWAATGHPATSYEASECSKSLTNRQIETQLVQNLAIEPFQAVKT
jgi:hypothetical protein